MSQAINFQSSTIDIAKELIGYEIVYHSKNGSIAGIINETEAYTQEDPASHSYGGKKTKRNEPMFLSGGHIYIYFVYGMYYCLNIVTEKEGRGCAVLIRSVIPTSGKAFIQLNRPGIQELNWCNGPSKFVMGFGIPKELNKESILDPHCPIKISNIKRPLDTIQNLNRVGIKKGTHLMWRFYVNPKSIELT